MKNKFTKPLWLTTSVLFIIICVGNVFAEPLEIKSPHGELRVSIDLEDQITYNIFYGKDVILQNCSLQLDLQNESLGVNPKLISKNASSISEIITPTVPLKNATIKNNCNVLVLNFEDDYSVEFRAYDDGVAYRFITRKSGDAIVLDESFEIQFPASYLSQLSFTGSFISSYEHPYSHVKTSEYKQSDSMTTLPVLLETDKQYKVLVSEADLLDYPCMFLKSCGNNGMESAFPKCPLEFGENGDRSLKITKEADYIAKTSGTRSFPWRLFVIAKEDK